MQNIFLSESRKPYWYFLSFAFALLLFGLIFNIAPLGGLYGTAAASISLKYDPLFTLGVIAIYFVRRPYIAFLAVVVFAVVYQVAVLELTDNWRLLGIRKPAYFNFGRIYGGWIVLGLVALVHLGIIKCKEAIKALEEESRTDNKE